LGIPDTPVLKKVWLYIFYFFILSLPVAGQQARQYSFTHYGVSSGLASNEATACLQDEQGFIWIAGNKGLQRFDGQRYLNFNYQKDNPAAIPHNYITQLLLDKKKNLWVLTGDGKTGIFNTATFVYSQVSVKVDKESILSGDRKLIMDEEGNLFIIYAHRGFVTWNEKNKEFSNAHNFIPLPPGWETSDCLQQPGTKKYWIAGAKGLAVFDRQTNQLSYKGHNVANEAIIEKLGDIPSPTRLLIDKQERLWFDAWLGSSNLFCFDLKKKESLLEYYSFVPISADYHELRGLLQQKDGTIWIKGLNIFARYLEKEKKFQQVYNGYQNEQSIEYDRVNDFFEDRDRNVWVATNNNGLYCFNPAEQFFTNIRQINRLTNLPGKGSMMSFILTKERTLLSGAWNDGLYRYDSNYRTVPLNIRGINEKEALSVWSMCFSPDSNIIWMGAQPGIWAINQSTQSAALYRPAIMQDRTVRQVATDKYGNLWMGTQSLGLFKWTAAKGKTKFEDGVTQYKAILKCQVRKIFSCNKGYIWVATSIYGLYAIDPATDKIIFHLGTEEPPERKLTSDGIVDVLQYDDSTLVIAGKSLDFFNLKKERIIKTISLPESQAANIAAMEKDKNGYLWISLSNGIYRLNPRNEIFIHFDRIDGIMNDHFVMAASYKLPGGRIIFGADNQFVIFDPLKVMLNDPAPDILITGIRLMNESLLVDSLLKKDRIELNPESNSIIIEFSGLGYGRAYISKYKLEGLDKDWIIADNTNQAVYSYLPPGNYIFLVKSEDAEGITSKNITKLIIKVKPPFWKTWWFLGLVAFAAVGLFYWLDKQRTQKIRATESIRTRIATSLTEDMSNSLSNINISSELAKNKIDTDTERTKEYIAQISDASNRMVQSMYDMVWSINPGNDNLPDTIARMKEFAAEIENSYDVSLIFDVDKEVMKLQLDMEYRYELLAIFKEAVTNAVRHANARHIQISLRFKNPKLIMMVEDDGKGFEDLQCGLLGRGIADMRRRASAIDASLHIETNENTGSIVKLEMNI
jgi:ligand-binding sensor domain-containing protein/two-component sensor histidine kinase